jgi:polar amino acid transport system permease protein
MQGSGIELLMNVKNWIRLLQGLWVTVQIALISVGLSVVLGILLGILMTVKNKVIHVICEVYLAIVRIMPQLALLFIVFFGLSRLTGINMNAWTSAIVVFTFWGTGEMGDLVRGSLESIPKHQYESAYALGMSKSQTFRYVVLPQTIRRLLPPSINLVTRMIKTTALVEIIGIVEVLKTGQQIIDANRMNYADGALWIYGAVFVLYFLICWPVSMYARHLEKKWR